MNDEFRDLVHIVLAALVCIAILYFWGMRVAMNDFIDDCTPEHTEQECIDMWSGK